MGFGWFVRHVPFVVGAVLITVYCALTGVTMSWIFQTYAAASVQKIGRMEHEQVPQLHNRAAIIGAMMLYTNFINLFLRLLEVFARLRKEESKTGS